MLQGHDVSAILPLTFAEQSQLLMNISAEQMSHQYWTPWKTTKLGLCMKELHTHQLFPFFNKQQIRDIISFHTSLQLTHLSKICQSDFILPVQFLTCYISRHAPPLSFVHLFWNVVSQSISKSKLLKWCEL